MRHEMKTAPPYAVASVDNALLLATMLQLEGRLTVTDAAQRLGIARSTAHRLLTMLVYRDFAVQDDSRAYLTGPVLDLATHSRSEVSQLRVAALPHVRALVDRLGETVNVIVRAHDTARFALSVECDRAPRIDSREGMVFPAHWISGGMVLLAELERDELEQLYATGPFDERVEHGPAVDRLHHELARVRRQGFAVNDGRSERGVVGVGTAIRRPDGSAAAALSVTVPRGRYDARHLPTYVAALRRTAALVEQDADSTWSDRSASTG